MSKDFFEVLREQAIENIRGDARNGRPGPLKRKWVNEGIEAHSQALRGMLVGGPILRVKVHHFLSRYLPGQERTEYLVETKDGPRRLFMTKGHHRTDGEEVEVCVFRTGMSEHIGRPLESKEEEEPG